MRLLEVLLDRWQNIDHPFFVHSSGELYFNQLTQQKEVDLSIIKSGDVVALIGDFEPLSILTLLRLIELDVILVPLTVDTTDQHEYFFEAAFVDVVVHGTDVTRRKHGFKSHLIESLRSKRHAGLVLFSTGTTGRPKAILHDLTLFMKRFETPRPTFRTLNFLLFDHIGGLNTLLHTLFNRGTVIAPKSRNVQDILQTCTEYQIEVLPTTPTFLRLMLVSGLLPCEFPKCLKVVTYGTERMDQPTLDQLCNLLPNVDFRQTFGMSELGIVRVKSQARDSLYMRIGGEGVSTRVVNNVLEIKSDTRMLGYLNAEDPFDCDGWYNTGDLVEERDGYYKVTGRTTEVINVGGLKFMSSEVERVALQHTGVELVKAEGKDNPITGQHVELLVQGNVEKKELKKFLSERLQGHMMPKRIKITTVEVGHRFKRR